VFGISARALGADAELAARVKAQTGRSLPPAVQADLPDWLWDRLAAVYGPEEAAAIAKGLLGAAPLDLRVNLAKLSREEALDRLDKEGAPTPLSPAGIRMRGKPAINRHALFLDGSLEVQDEGSQLLAYLLAPRRGEMVADFCAGAGGKTLAISMLMHGSGRVYAMDVSEKRLRELSPRAARAGISNVHPIVLSDEGDVRAKATRGQARSRAGGCALQRLRHVAPQPGPEMAARRIRDRRTCRKAGAHPGMPRRSC
jgi:16S rRNA (cytosine967-C5)-methyltransferase